MNEERKEGVICLSFFYTTLVDIVVVKVVVKGVVMGGVGGVRVRPLSNPFMHK